MSLLNIFDLDDTLFRTDAKLYIKFSKKQLHTYHDMAESDIDFSEFESAEIFHKTAVPIDAIIKKFKNIKRNNKSKIIIITARGDLDDRNLFLKTLDKYGVYSDHIHVHRAGNLTHIESTPLRKCHIIEQYLNTGKYKKVRMFDDSIKNLDAFINLKEKYPKIKFHPFIVTPKGELLKYKP